VPLVQALGNAAAAVQSAALSGLASLSDGAHAALPPAWQRHLWAAVAAPLDAGSGPKAQPAAAVQAAAARAVGALAALPSFVHTRLGAGLCMRCALLVLLPLFPMRSVGCCCHCSNAALASTNLLANRLYMQCDAVVFESSGRLRSE
jgi:hypothetical protein